MAKFKVFLKKSAVKQLRVLPNALQKRILGSISNYLAQSPYLADGKHIKKLIDGYRLRVGNYRIFYYIEGKTVVITSIVKEDVYDILRYNSVHGRARLFTNGATGA